MTRKIIVSIAVTLLLAAAGCRKEAPANQDATSGNSASDTATTQAAADTSADTTTALTRTVAPPPYIVQVEFEGAISHILGQSPQRAVLIKDAYHISRLLIRKPTQIGKDKAESESRLKDALPNGVNVSCDPNFCEVTPLTGLVIRVVDDAEQAIQPALSEGPDFKALVTHLSEIATITAVSDTLDDDYPSGDFTTFFELNGGTFSASPYCEPVNLERPDHTLLGERNFARATTLTGYTNTKPKLEFSTDGKTWKAVTMDRVALLSLLIDNMADQNHKNMPHLELHQKIAKGSVTDFPTIKDVKLCLAGAAVGCGNSQWP